MTIQKLPSGSYRIMQMHNRIRYSVTIKHKPTKTEAQSLIQAEIDKHSYISISDAHKRVHDACRAYLDSKSAVLSPSTIRSYSAIIRATPESFLALPLGKVDTLAFQKLINEYSIGHTPKTTSNFTRFYSAVFNLHGLDLGRIQLPQKEKKSVYIPTEDEVRRILEYSAGSQYEISLKLAVLGLRRGEICALTLADLDGRKLHICKSKVKSDEDGWIIKPTKTTDSTRTLMLPSELAEQIRQKGSIFDGSPDRILTYLNRVQDTLGITRFSLHKLRHFYASYLHDKGYTDKQIQEMGGWKTNNIMSTIYQHAMEMDRAKSSASDDIGRLF